VGAHRAALILAAQGCAIAAILSADLIVLVFSVQLALICLWGLVSVTVPQRGLRFLLLAQVCGLLMLGGALLMWRHVGDTSIQALPLLLLSTNPSVLRLVSVLVLLGLLPLISGAPAYGWLSSLLPLKRNIPMAPATLLVIMGTALMLRLLPGVLLLPGVPTFAALCLILGLFSLWWGGLRAWIATDMGAFAAWLTVAQSGYVLVALAAASSPNAPPAVMQAAAMQVVLAPLAVLTIWSVASYVAARTGSDALPGISGMIKTMPLAGVALLAGGLSLAGVPPLAGFHVQRLLIAGLFAEARPALGVVVVLADLLLVAAVIGVFRQAFLRGEPPPPAAPASSWLSGQLALLTLGIVLVGVWPGPLMHWTDVICRTALSVKP
jgi:formate hydrogenlyase subunit 3/multisubunit Na+/H+ antiporter MnhD subunit